MRLLLDAQISPGRIAKPLRQRGHDVLALNAEPELQGISDIEVLKLAASDNRIVVTYDIKDFPRLTKQWAEAARSHCGVIVVASLRPNDYGALLRGLDRLFDQLPNQEDWVNLTRWL